MSTTTNNTLIQSNEDLEKLTSGNVLIIADYSFANPYSINGPLGTLNITLTNDDAFGEIEITTLYGLGTKTTLNFQGSTEFNPSTGYTTIHAIAKGVTYIPFDKPKSIKTEVSISLNPGFKEGTMSVKGFFNDYKLTLTKIYHLDNN